MLRVAFTTDSDLFKLSINLILYVLKHSNLSTKGSKISTTKFFFLNLLKIGVIRIGDTAVKDMYEAAKETDFNLDDEEELRKIEKNME